MSSKIGTILSMIFVTIFFLLGIDLLSLQTTYSSLDSKAVSISYLIAKSGGLSQSLINHIEDTYKVDFTCLSNCNPIFGDILDYSISTNFDPIMLSDSTYTVTIKRQAIIGFYN
jgi:hypothetical protein